MEFWGVEVKSGEPLKVQPEFGKLVHISQAALGEVKDAKGAKYVPLRLKVGDKSFIIGSLAAEDRTQLMFDLVFEKEFELSHDWKNGSVYFLGYVAEDPVDDGQEFDSDDFEDESEDELVEALENGKIKPKSGDVKAAKTTPAAAAAKAKAGAKKEEESESDDDEDDDESDSDDEMAIGRLEEDSSDVSGDDSEEDEDDSSDDEEELPKVQQSKKRPAESPQKTPAKKAKSATPDKSGKKGHIATPFPSKAAGKTPADKKSKEQTPKSGSQIACKSCSKTFTSPNALQSHSKAKHGGK